MKHVGGSISDSDYTKIDYNRAGTPLLEIVTDPDFKSPEEARAYLQQLAQIFQYLEIYSPNQISLSRAMLTSRLMADKKLK